MKYGEDAEIPLPTIITTPKEYCSIQHMQQQNYIYSLIKVHIRMRVGNFWKEE